MRVIFFGTPAVAVPFLEKLNVLHSVAAVVTRSDKPAQRGKSFQACAVKQKAQQLNIPVLQPEKLKDPTWIETLKSFGAEAGVVVAYGRILPVEVLSLFPRGLFNVHFSLVPELRGAAPMRWAILRGLSKTGVTLFELDAGLDTGKIAWQAEQILDVHEDALSLERKLIAQGVLGMENVLEKIAAGTLTLQPQMGEPSLAPPFTRDDARIRWESAVQVERQVRAFLPEGAFTHLPNGQRLKILQVEARAVNENSTALPGTLVSFERGKGFLVQCEKGQVLILRLQREGKAPVDAWAFLQGRPCVVGDRLA